MVAGRAPGVAVTRSGHPLARSGRGGGRRVTGSGGATAGAGVVGCTAAAATAAGQRRCGRAGGGC
uniref:Uncharacterized protein n=1 Tax=Leersia perrieri TaxID=77586 RepID=A0A0D9WQ22_9ORYZ